MRSIEEILVGWDMTADEFKAINEFWNEIRLIQGRRSDGVSRNRYLVGVAMGNRRLGKREIDIEALASLTGLGRSSLQKTLKDMVVDSLIRLETDPDDRRRTLVKPSEEYIRLSLNMYLQTRQLIRDTCNKLEVLRASDPESDQK
ncbi:hypothetical protein [Sneathiella sp.]|uniref:hypothetical protein n=1 Tax=Sneathiella sp. TaxID=1964365 RepID=UPI0035658F99